MQFSQHTARAAYQQGEISSAGPMRIVVLLYEGALRFSRQALDKFEDPALRGHALGRAHRIVSELLAALDHDQGAEIATNLDNLYGYLLDSFTRANVHGDRGSLQSAIEVLDSLLPAWREVENRKEKGEL